MPNIDPSGVQTAFLDFFQLGPIAWGMSIIIGGSVAAFIARLIFSAFWR